MKHFLPFIMPFIVLMLLIVSIIYISRRYTVFFDLQNTKTLYFIVSAIVVFMLGSLIAFTNTTSQLLSILYMIGALLIGFYLYLTIFTVIIDTSGFFLNISPKNKGLISLGLTSLIVLYGLFNAWNIRTTHLEVPLADLQKEVRIAHLTDIHIGHFRGKRWMQKIVNKTMSQEPDIVVITGDLFDGKIRLNMDAIEPLKQLKVPIYFVEGNHDGYSNVKVVKRHLAKSGIRVLSNQISIRHGLQIIGLNHMLADRNSVDIHAINQRKTIEEVLEALNINNQQPAILLHHSPDGIQYANKMEIDLYLAGHTHAGQLFPINIIAKWIFPYNKGLHDYKGTKIFVSEGVGTFGPPIRIATKSEIAIIDLKINN